MEIRKPNDEEFVLRFPENNLILDRTQYEDIFYCLPLEASRLLVFINETVLNSRAQRNILDEYVNQHEDIDTAMKELSETVQAFSPDHPLTSKSGSENESETTTPSSSTNTEEPDTIDVDYGQIDQEEMQEDQDDDSFDVEPVDSTTDQQESTVTETSDTGDDFFDEEPVDDFDVEPIDEFEDEEDFDVEPVSDVDDEETFDVEPVSDVEEAGEEEELDVEPVEGERSPDSSSETQGDVKVIHQYDGLPKLQLKSRPSGDFLLSYEDKALEIPSEQMEIMEDNKDASGPAFFQCIMQKVLDSDEARDTFRTMMSGAGGMTRCLNQIKEILSEHQV